MIVPVIMSGGAGTRLWPLSRELYPKQFLPLAEERTMLQATLSRLDGLPEQALPLIVCNEQHRFLVAEQLRQISSSAAAIILEPVGRNTAPAVAVAALQAVAEGADPLLLVLAADHVIPRADIFRETVQAAVAHAEAGRLVTFGIVPTMPETGYGYIRGGARVGGDKDTALAVAAFVEKPDLVTAQSYLASGDYFWNSGMFLFKASTYLEALAGFAPDILAACRRSFTGASRDLDFVRLEAAAFSTCRSDSIDYAVMEKADNGVMLPLAADWSDVGSWSALWEIGSKDAAGNHVEGDVLAVATSGCYLKASSRLLAAVGLEDLVVVETADAVMVAHRDKVQEVKKIVEALKAAGRSEAVVHRRASRPWGSYECIDKEGRFQVKRITVNPGASLSLQLHHHRAEHWIVVHGTARITCGDEIFTLGENQSTYIPLGVVHRLENPGKIPLELIEVQSGSYLGEDDIVRFDDQYGRQGQ
ncbi:MAG: mannose-1-phosphate guanylyltransferase/mannose-6-phosphate isomerase [Desulfuromonadales bacterium GWC2_61_20]|nr:MAG: mannose-1-phosphate guanylyltransferase/mannose-6-phosphate isomerase [Desulfuromonadales bacterium GWC2_61_20]